MVNTANFNHIEPSTLEKFFAAFKKEAFRLELLSTYQIEEEKPTLEKYRSGTIQSSADADMEDWCSEIADALKAGRSFRRIRRVDAAPSEYTRFEIECGYRFSVPAGEDVRLIETPLSDLKLNDVVPAFQDFWIFDSTICVLLDYTPDGKYLGARSTESQGVVERYMHLKEELLSKATDIRRTRFWNSEWGN